MNVSRRTTRNHRLASAPPVASSSSSLLTGVFFVAVTLFLGSAFVAAEMTTYDPPITSTTYTGGCDEGEVTKNELIRSLTDMSWGTFCQEIENKDTGEISYQKMNLDCKKYIGTRAHYYDCNDDQCNDCADSLSDGPVYESSWDFWLVDNSKEEASIRCYNDTVTWEEEGTEYNLAVQYQYDGSTNAQEYMTKMITHSCVNSWLPYVPIDNDDEVLPDTAVMCFGENDYCNCKRDCVEYADSWCSCPDALACCDENDSYNIYDADNNGVPDSFVQCPQAQDLCDCNNDCYFNRDQCSCDEAQKCCSNLVVCPDASGPNEHCNCAHDCIFNPQYCLCGEAQTCCDEYLSSHTPTVDEMLVSFPVVDTVPHYDGSIDDSDNKNYERVVLVVDPSADDNEEEYGFACHSIQEMICSEDVFSSLCTLLYDTSPELGDELATAGNRTFFAPTNAAIKANQDLLDNSTEDELLRILMFHDHVGSIITPWQLECTEKIIMSSGDESRTRCERNKETGYITKYQKGNGNYNMDIMPKIEFPSLRACNGIIHVIDNVMIPVGGK